MPASSIHSALIYDDYAEIYYTNPSGKLILGTSALYQGYESVLEAMRLRVIDSESPTGYTYIPFTFARGTPDLTPVKLVGGTSDDVLYGGMGADILKGGKGADIFYNHLTYPSFGHFDTTPQTNHVQVTDVELGLDKVGLISSQHNDSRLQIETLTDQGTVTGITVSLSPWADVNSLTATFTDAVGQADFDLMVADAGAINTLVLEVV